MYRLLAICLFILAVGLTGAVPSSRAESPEHSPGSANAAASTSPQAAGKAAATTTSTYVIVAWSELGMHCMDGKDYSVFSVLPPYNTIHAQLLKRGEPPTA